MCKKCLIGLRPNTLKILLKKLSRAFRSLQTRPNIYGDVGARWGLEEPWKSLRECVSVVSFEADVEEYKVLLQKKQERDLVLNCILNKDTDNQRLNLTRKRGCSSIYEPNLSFLENFPELDRYYIEEQVDATAMTLDALYLARDISDMDFLKLDVQGAELIGFGINSVTGDYSRGAAGLWIENGEISHPFEEVTVAGNLKDIFRSIVSVGNDIDVRRSTRCGSILVDGLTIAGE